MWLIEWFFNLFLSKKAKEEKRKAFLDRTKAVMDFNKSKKVIEKHNYKYSGKRRYTKA